MSARSLARRIACCVWLMAGVPACLASGLVGEGSDCPEGCSAEEVCKAGACVHRDGAGEGGASGEGGGGHGGDDDDDGHDGSDHDLPDDGR